jgi:DNA modification methylase
MRPYYERAGITIYHGDSREVLPHLEAADLLFTSPPYAQQRTYGQDGFDWAAVVPDTLAGAVLKPDGQMLVNLGLVHRDGAVIEYWRPMIWRLQAAGYRLFGWYVWDQGFGMTGDWNGRLAPSHEFIFHFNRESKRPHKIEPCKTFGKRECGDTFRKPDGSTKPLSHKGRPVQETKIPDSVIRINRHMARGAEISHPAVFPVTLAQRVIETYSNTSDLVLDPFLGSGTTALAARQTGRRCIGVEWNEAYCELAARRLEAEAAQLPLEVTA